MLGDGNQKKSYLNIKDCIEAIYKGMKYFDKKINVINLGTNEYINVKKSIQIICQALRLKPKIIFKGGKRGWVGDNPFIFLDTKKVRLSGWRPKYSINESVKVTTKYLLKNSWLLKKN